AADAQAITVNRLSPTPLCHRITAFKLAGATLGRESSLQREQNERRAARLLRHSLSARRDVGRPRGYLRRLSDHAERGDVCLFSGYENDLQVEVAPHCLVKMLRAS
ncbi:MAG: hypothetical protein WAS73_19345, partial [Defluviicoccus sp.]